jgi:hypothetical protein
MHNGASNNHNPCHGAILKAASYAKEFCSPILDDKNKPPNLPGPLCNFYHPISLDETRRAALYLIIPLFYIPLYHK